MTEIYRVATEVLVEADSAEEAQARARAFLDQLDESEVWSSEVGIALKDAEETVLYHKLHHEIPGDIRSFGEAP